MCTVKWSKENFHPEIWEDGDNHISASLTGFNFSSDGWQTDKDGIKCLRVSGDARVTIPYHIFAKDFRTTGKTIEMEFSTRNVLDYDAVILSCMSGDRGLSLTAQKALLKSEQSEISTQYKDDEHEALDYIAAKARELGVEEEKAIIPTLVKLDRQRVAKNDDTLPYESMKIDRLRGGAISFSETKEYGEVEIREEGDKVLISIIGVDDEGSFSAASAFSIDEFMNGEDNWLEQAIGSILFYGKVYED